MSSPAVHSVNRLARDLGSINLHSSPPPSLSSRMRNQQQDEASSGSSRDVSPLRPREEERRSPPDTVKDPVTQLNIFIQHLLIPENAESNPQLMAIGYELEALLSIYPEALRLIPSSRPPSLASSPSRPFNPTPTSTPTQRPSISDSPSRYTTDPSSSSSSARPRSAIEPNKRSSKVWEDAVFDASVYTPGDRIRYEISIPLWDQGENLEGLDNLEEMPSREEDIPNMRILVSLPPTYPGSAPQLQLLGRYLGNFGIDAGLFGDVTRTYIASNAIPFTPGDVCIFEGLTYARETAKKWYAARLNEIATNEQTRIGEKSNYRNSGQGIGRGMEEYITTPNKSGFGFNNHNEYNGEVGYTEEDEFIGSGRSSPSRPSNRATFSYTRHDDHNSNSNPSDSSYQYTSTIPSTSPSHLNGAETPISIHQAESGHFPHFVIHKSSPLIDRKSTFIGHAIRVSDEREVPLVIHEILSDKRVAKATHPAMFAYRIMKDKGGVAGKVMQIDCDDDGESAAGSRLSHLLEILEVENVLVVVSRWYGGVQLGADRFKHINHVAREAMEVGGMLPDKGNASGKGGKSRRS